MKLIDGDALVRKISASYNMTDDHGIQTGYEICMRLVEDAPTIEPEPQWIPCSERLPEEGQDILAYRVFGDDERIIPANYGNGCWFDCHMNCSVGHVVAWMPLPKPYGGEQDE